MQSISDKAIEKRLSADMVLGVSYSALVSLKYRVDESLKANGLYKDPVGERFLAQIDCDWNRFTHSPSSWGVAVRTEILDTVVSDFIKRNPRGVVINFGAGLCTRFWRISTPEITWVEIDFPEMIAFRKKLNEPFVENHIFFPGSLSNPNILKELAVYSDKPVLFIAEGVLMYLAEEEVKGLFCGVAEIFPYSEILFEAISSSFMFLKRMFQKTQFKWSLDRGDEVEKWDKKIKFIEEWFYADRHKEMLHSFRRALFVFPFFRKTLKIVHIKVVS
ncbi:MAG: class I SAM-dependent methyltransferase [Candidatus Omnitrophica bacterium]|nr:class I SAM-dependent methyltransferase [Candidatus Omnitrophota bacterium]